MITILLKLSFLPFENLAVFFQISLVIGQIHFELYLEIAVFFLFVAGIFLKPPILGIKNSS